ncbi:hypothetical protein [Streptomyces nanshensis]|uniref:PIN domain-containing protein n=1 Tax=Streptomyces nanshensis TaxID=518642 RepID=A0A1E7L990_9ACTN|nr:hypothetical protein [Streptomyces nanshensis]OEV12724.1 hypothetical protein AN218_06995 [Streptomyces nanshensis]
MNGRRFVFDASALLAAGAGDRLASTLIHQSNFRPEWSLYVPLGALIQAEWDRKGIAEHFAALPGVVFVEMDLPAALSVSKASPDAWAESHVVHVATPSPLSPVSPSGATVVTVRPELYPELRTLDIRP